MKNFWNFWKCKKCQKTFRKPYQLRNHAAIHISGLSFSCSYCDERFTTKMRLSKHKRIKHRNIMKKNSENSQCEQSEFQKQKLREVEELLMEVNGVWKCKECNKTASEKCALRKHAEMHVSGLIFPCNHCSEIFPTRNRLAHHKFARHRGEKHWNIIICILLRHRIKTIFKKCFFFFRKVIHKKWNQVILKEF